MATYNGDNELTEQIIESIIAVHQTLGPGFLESVYRNALAYELEQRGLLAEQEREVPVYYKDSEVGLHRLDLLVEHRVVVELKTVEHLGGAHYSQLRSYLRATELDLGLLVNFAGRKADFRRVENPLGKRLCK